MAIGIQAALNCSEDVRRYLMSTGIQEIVDKIFASDKFGFLIGNLVPKIQNTGLVQLLQTLNPEYFADKELKDLPDFVEDAEGVSNDTFTKLQQGSKTF